MSKGKEVAVKEEFAIMQGNIEDVKAMIEANLGEGESIGIGDLSRITMPSGKSTTWIIPDIEAEGGEIETKAITGVIVSTQTTRQYWETSFEEGGGNPPDCASVDGITGVGNPGGECLQCEKNEFKSEGGKNRAKECQERKLVFVVLRDDVLPTLISAPPASLKNIRQYLFELTKKRRFIHSVYTEITLTTDKNDDGIFYPKMVFRKVGDVENQEATKGYAEALKPFLKRTVTQATMESTQTEA